MNTMKTNSKKVNVGIDVGKSQLDVFIHEREIHFSVDNTPSGVKKALGRISRYPVERIVVEATGRYEHALVEASGRR